MNALYLRINILLLLFFIFFNKVEGFDKMIENDSLKRGVITRRNDDKVYFVTGKGSNRCRPYLKPTVHLYLANTSSTLLSSGVPQEVKIILSFSWLARPRDEGTRAVTRIGHGSLSEWVGRDVTCWMMNYCSCCRLVVMVKDGVSMEGC
jgi:hypothetical protein